MLLNLSKNFSFQNENDMYNVGYFFTRDVMSDEALPAQNLWMVLKISVNDAEQLTFRIQKPTTILYQANEQIEAIIRTEAIALSSKTVAD
jgi:hypothetical protein